MKVKLKAKFIEEDEYTIIKSTYRTNGAIALTAKDSEGFPAFTITTNLEVSIPEGYIAVKHYSENEGLVQALIEADIIESIPLRFIQSGFVEIPVHKLTAKGLSI